MKFDIGDRRSGKTTRMIQWLLNGREGERRLLVVHSAQEVERLQRMLKDMGIERDNIEIINVNDLRNLRGKSVIVGVDNLELILSQLIPAPITRVTASGELYQDD